MSSIPSIHNNPGGQDPLHSVQASQITSSVDKASNIISVLPSKIENTEIEKKTFTHSVGILAGFIVLAVAITVVVVALTVLAPGVPQSILLGIALSGVGLGGFSVMKNLVYIVRDLIAPRMKEKTRLRSALAVGIGFSGFGLALKLGSSFVPGGYGNLIGNLGSSAYSKGGQSVFTSLSHFIYMRFARSEKVARGEALSPQETLVEAKKLQHISLSLGIIGVGLVVLGVLLAVVGSVMLSGTPAMIAIIFAPPLISIGISTVLKTILRSSLSQWKNFLDAQVKRDLLVETSLKDIRSQGNKQSENVQKTQENKKAPKIISIEEEEENAGIPREYVNISESLNRISNAEINQKFSLTTRQKVIFALTTLLFLAAFAALLASGLGGLVGVQALLVVTVGSAVASTTLPIVSSGLSYYAFQLKSRLHISKLRWKELRDKRHVRKSLEKVGVTYTTKEFNKAWEVVYKKSVLETERAIREEVHAFEKGGEASSSIVGGILIGVGVGIMLLSLVPIFAPVIPGFLALGGVFLSLGGAILLQKLVHWLHEELIKIRNRQKDRQRYIYGSKDRETQDLSCDILVDGIASGNEVLFDDGFMDFMDEVIDFTPDD
ncbi:hypothetical protein [Chlamydia sp. 17-3921]|uniref:hypothetical protein n=1 Tax=Chlamydia sp. 17-3921 TaxID=2675798 RepID=UPI0019182E5A|nr:hypothetical protein [Chlamydia sp. 17-3921]